MRRFGWSWFLAFLTIFLTLAYFQGCGKDSTDPPGLGRSGIRIYVDAEFGCHYLGNFLGGLTPRMDADGKHYCEPPEEEEEEKP